MEIYTDGSSLGNPGPSAAAFVVVENNQQVHAFSEFIENATNSQAELCAFVFALDWIEHQCNPCTQVTIYSDSQYVVKGCNEWMEGWSKKNFNVKNPEFWRHIYVTFKKLNVIVVWVKAHSTSKWNNAVDQLAQQTARKGNK